jgi:hypothetical protein
MRTAHPRPCLLLAAAAWMAIISPAMASPVITSEDANTVIALVQKVARLGGDLAETDHAELVDSVSKGDWASAYQALHASTCFDGEMQALATLTNDLVAAQVELAILSDLRDKRDEASALAVARISFSGLERDIPVARKDVNGWMGTCADNAAVAAKAQALLNFLDEVDMSVAPIAARVGLAWR